MPHHNNLSPYLNIRTQDDAKQEEHGSSFCLLWQQLIWHCQVLLRTLGPILAPADLQQGIAYAVPPLFNILS